MLKAKAKSKSKKQKQNKEKNKTWDSSVVNHTSTNQTICLTSPISREAALSSWYGHSLLLSIIIRNYTLKRIISK
jgi:hypothetical protein